MSPVFYEENPNPKMEDVILAIICDHPFPMHVHDAVEIVCPTQGSLDMTIAGEKVRVMPGDVAIAFPTVPHSYDYVSQDIDGLALIFTPGTIQEFCNTFRTTVPKSGLLQKKNVDPEMAELILKMKNLPEEKKKALKLGHVHLFLSYLLMSLTLRPVVLRSAWMQRTVGLLLLFCSLYPIWELVASGAAGEQTADFRALSAGCYIVPLLCISGLVAMRLWVTAPEKSHEINEN